MIERGAMRYTPAGLPALDLTLRHESTASEAGMARKVALELKALGIGPVTKQLGSIAVGSAARFSGFLATARNGRGVVLHITEVRTASI